MRVFNFTYTDQSGVFQVSKNYKTPQEAKEKAEWMIQDGRTQNEKINIFQDTTGDDAGLDCTVVAVARLRGTHR